MAIICVSRRESVGKGGWARPRSGIKRMRHSVVVVVVVVVVVFSIPDEIRAIFRQISGVCSWRRCFHRRIFDAEVVGARRGFLVDDAVGTGRHLGVD